MRYTDEEVYQIGFRHGTDGICYHPPSRWETKQWLIAPDIIYAKGYHDGQVYYQRFQQRYSTTEVTS